jgi:hypothetical protein
MARPNVKVLAAVLAVLGMTCIALLDRQVMDHLKLQLILTHPGTATRRSPGDAPMPAPPLSAVGFEGEQLGSLPSAMEGFAL